MEDSRGMGILLVYVRGLFFLLITLCDGRNIQCPELPNQALKAILGTTYNGRYMSIQLPVDTGTTIGRGGPKRASHDDHNFFMDDADEDNPYEGIPAWEVDHVSIGNERRKRREAKPPTKERDPRQVFLDRVLPAAKKDVFQSRPWECKAEVHWMDLGTEYFPRYLRTIKCMKKSCWYGHYTCKARKFSTKVLRRSTGQCAKVSQRLKIITMDAVTGEFAQLWEFEEKAVTFCCDCVI